MMKYYMKAGAFVCEALILCGLVAWCAVFAIIILALIYGPAAIIEM